MLYAELMSQKNIAAEYRAESNKAEMKHGSEGAMKSLNSETSGEGRRCLWVRMYTLQKYKSYTDNRDHKPSGK